jgi:hypothetical protein
MPMNTPQDPRNRQWGPQHYDEHLALKVPALMWLTLAFLVRHLLLLGITFMPTTGAEITVLRDLIRPEYVIADLIALPVLVVAVRRRPQAPEWMRKLWPAGRALLTLSTLVYLALLGWTLLGSERRLMETVNEATLISILLSVAILLYLWRSVLVRDLFRDFPV